VDVEIARFRRERGGEDLRDEAGTCEEREQQRPNAFLQTPDDAGGLHEREELASQREEQDLRMWARQNRPVESVAVVTSVSRALAMVRRLGATQRHGGQNAAAQTLRPRTDRDAAPAATSKRIPLQKPDRDSQCQSAPGPHAVFEMHESAWR